MKIAELLRKLADMAEAEEAESNINGGGMETVPSDLNAQADDYGDSPDEVYVGPLQQKHELLKKATGVENNVDQFADDDELAQIKQNAGIAPTVINQTFEINPGAAQPVTPLDTAIITPLADDFTDSD